MDTDSSAPLHDLLVSRAKDDGLAIVLVTHELDRVVESLCIPLTHIHTEMDQS